MMNDLIASSSYLPNSSTGLQLCGSFSLCTKIEKRRFERIAAADVVDVRGRGYRMVLGFVFSIDR